MNGSRVSLTVRMGPEGSLRPDVLVRAAIRTASLSAAISRTTRTDALIERDEGVWARPV